MWSDGFLTQFACWQGATWHHLIGPRGTFSLVHAVPHGANIVVNKANDEVLTEMPRGFFSTSASGGSHLPRQHWLGWHVAAYGPHTCNLFPCSLKTSEGHNFFIRTPFEEPKPVPDSAWWALHDGIGFMRFWESEILSYLRSSWINMTHKSTWKGRGELGEG